MGPSRLARLAAACVVVAILAAVHVVPAGADTAAELRLAEARLDELLDRMAAERRTLVVFQEEAGALARRIDRVESRIARTQGEIVHVELQVREASGRLAATQDLLDRRARVAFENGPGSSLEFILGARSLTDLTTRLKIVDRAAASDHDLLMQVEGLREQLRAKQGELDELVGGFRGVHGSLAGDYAAMSEKVEAAQRVEEQLELDRAEAEGLVARLERKRQAELEEERRRLAALARQQRQASGGSGNWVDGMILVCPVDGAVAYWDDFGAPRYTGGYHQHAGNDMFAAYGTPVVAPFNGTAVDASNGIGGLSVKVYGQHGYVYNAHLSSIARVGPVRAGDVIGYVGDTGNAKGTSPHNHFEWRPNTPPPDAWTSPYGASVVGSAVDPYPYLNAVC